MMNATGAGSLLCRPPNSLAYRAGGAGQRKRHGGRAGTSGLSWASLASLNLQANHPCLYDTRLAGPHSSSAPRLAKRYSSIMASSSSRLGQFSSDTLLPLTLCPELLAAAAPNPSPELASFCHSFRRGPISSILAMALWIAVTAAD